MLYNVVLVSAVQQLKSVITLHISPLSWASLLPTPFPSLWVITKHQAGLLVFSEISLWGQKIGKTHLYLTRFLVTTEGGGCESVGSDFGFNSSSPLNLGPSGRSRAHCFPSWRRVYDEKDREVLTSMSSWVLCSFSYGQNF